jgi:uncharacterized membrane protein
MRHSSIGTGPQGVLAMRRLIYAFVSAGPAALTAILAKLGVEGVSSNLATAVRTVVITAFAWTIVLAAALLGESIGWRLSLGVPLMTIGAILTIGA